MEKRPLTYHEVVEGKPFEREIKGVGKLSIPLFSAQTLMKVSIQKQNIDNLYKKIEKGDNVPFNCYVLWDVASKIIYDVCEKPFFVVVFKKRFFKWAKENIKEVLTILDDLLSANTQIFFLMKRLTNSSPVPVGGYKVIGSLTTVEDTTPKPRHGSISDIYEKLKKPTKSESMA